MARIHTENRAGKPVRVADYHLIPVERFHRIQPPGMWGVLLWRRPTAVIIQHPDAADEVIEIHDSTREAQIFLLVLGLVVSIILLLLNSSSSERRNNNV